MSRHATIHRHMKELRTRIRRSLMMNTGKEDGYLQVNIDFLTSCPRLAKTELRELRDLRDTEWQTMSRKKTGPGRSSKSSLNSWRKGFKRLASWKKQQATYTEVELVTRCWRRYNWRAFEIETFVYPVISVSGVVISICVFFWDHTRHISFQRSQEKFSFVSTSCRSTTFYK